MYLLGLLEKSLKGSLTEDEAPQLIRLLESEIQFVKDMFGESMYVVTIENTTGHETGIASQTIDVVCRKTNGVYQNIRTNEVYGSSVISAKKLIKS